MSWLAWFFELDPRDLLLLALTLGVVAWARRRIAEALTEAARVPGPEGLSAAEAAAEVLRVAGAEGVAIEVI